MVGIRFDLPNAWINRRLGWLFRDSYTFVKETQYL